MGLQSASEREWAASVRFENDCFGGTDRYYTDGVSLGVSHTGPSWIDPFANWLPWGEGRRTVGYDVTQGMFTPADKSRSVPDPKDRPYAGILSFGLTLHVEKENSYHGLKFMTGVVGPWALAKETQNGVHSLIGDGESAGWDHQLYNEPIFNLAYEYRHRFQLAGDREQWSLQASPVGGGWLENVLIQGQIGGLVRAGYNMPDDFGPTLVRDMGYMPPPRRDARSQSSDWGFSVYGGSLPTWCCETSRLTAIPSRTARVWTRSSLSRWPAWECQWAINVSRLPLPSFSGARNSKASREIKSLTQFPSATSSDLTTKTM